MNRAFVLASLGCMKLCFRCLCSDLWYDTCWWRHSVGDGCRTRERRGVGLVTPLRGVGPLTFTLTFDTWQLRATRVVQMDKRVVHLELHRVATLHARTAPGRRSADLYADI